MINTRRDLRPFLKLQDLPQTLTLAEALPLILPFVSTPSPTYSTFPLNPTKPHPNDVTMIYCKYHRKWELVHIAAFSRKTNSVHTLRATTCAEGAKHRRSAAAIRDHILGEDAPESVRLQETLRIIPRADGHGYDTDTDAILAISDLFMQEADHIPNRADRTFKNAPGLQPPHDPSLYPEPTYRLLHGIPTNPHWTDVYIHNLDNTLHSQAFALNHNPYGVKL